MQYTVYVFCTVRTVLIEV